MAVDDSYTKALLHMDGADMSTTFTDESGKTWTTAGNAQIDTAQSKFGGASGLFDGTDDYIYTADHVDFYFSADFTIDFWIRFNALPGSGSLVTLYSQYTDVNDYIEYRLVNTLGTYSIECLSRVGGGAAHTHISKALSGLSTATWYHLAITRSGNDYRIFLNGTQQGTTATDATAMPNIAGTVKIGTFDGIDANRDLNGWVDEFRVSNGIARWTANFAPPSQAYPLSVGFAAFF